MYKYICKYCYKEFTTKFKNQKFCCKKCSVIYNNIARGVGDIVLTCSFCHREFTVKHKYRHRKFCCHKCSSDFSKDPVLSQEARKNKSESHKGIIPTNKNKSYEELYGEKRAKEIKVKIKTNTKKRPKKMIALICINCKKEFLVEYSYRNRKFCCHKCSSDFTKGKKRLPMSIETKKKLSVAKKGKIRKQSQEEIKNRRIYFLKRIQDRLKDGQQLVPNWNQKACEYFKQFDEENNTQGQYATNGGEYHIKELGYWIDYINHDLKLIIEWDERKHFDVYGNLKEKDIIRQNEIQEMFPEYEFRRIKE